MKTIDWLRRFRKGRNPRAESRFDGTNRQAVEALEPRIVLAAPMLSPISDVTVVAGSPLHIALNASDADGDALTFSATSTNPDVDTHIPEGNRSLRINVRQGPEASPTIQGEMVFELFERRVRRATNQVIALANSGFYNGAIFHDVTAATIATGDPLGMPPGAGNVESPRGPFDDQFDLDLQHNTTGILTTQRGADDQFDDTSDSRFEITEYNAGTETTLFNKNFQNTIFGFQTQGESIREMISSVATTNARPDVDVVMTSVDVFLDDQNGVLMVSAPYGTPATTSTITVTVTDAGGETHQQTFDVTIESDTTSNRPFLADVPRIRTLKNVPTGFQLIALDVEGMPNATFADELEITRIKGPGNVPVPSHADIDYTVQQMTGEVEVTPTNDFTGTTEISVAAGEFSFQLDFQVIPIEIVDSPEDWSVSAADHPLGNRFNDGEADEFRVVRNLTRIEIWINGVKSSQAEAASITTLNILGSDDDDKLIVDLSGGNPFPSGGINFAGGNHTLNGDEAELRGGNASLTRYVFQNATDGTIEVDGSMLIYTGLEPITDNLNVVDRVLTLSGVDDVATLGDDGTPGNGLSRFSTAGTSETLDFTEPTGSLTVNLGDGNDSITIGDLDSGSFPVSVSGGAGNDTLNGGAGDDSLEGGEGDDLLVGFNGDDSMNGGPGNDNLFGASHNDLLLGGPGMDLLRGQGGNADTISGEAGNDIIDGGGGALDRNVETFDEDLVITDNSITGLEMDQLSNVEIIEVNGGPSDNLLNADSVTAGVQVILRGLAGNDTLRGGAGNDILEGGDGVDVINAFGGNDTASGGDQNDFIFGGTGSDQLDGGPGDDRLRGQGTSNDRLTGGPGNDEIDGGPGTDVVVEQNDADFVITNTQLIGNGTDTLIGIQQAVITGGPSDNFLDASAFLFDTTSVTLDGASGDDSVVGTQNPDVLRDSGDGNDTLGGLGGDDLIMGGSGSDFLDGGPGNDRVRGQGASNDTVKGGFGHDTLDGGAGADWLIETYDGDFELTDANLRGGPVGTDRVLNSERVKLVVGPSNNRVDMTLFQTDRSDRVHIIVGGAGDDELIGPSPATGHGGIVRLFGQDGNDTLTGGLGHDSILGGNGHDVITADRGVNLIEGNDGNDTLTGGLSAETIKGGEGNDSIVANGGRDRIYGEAGDDFLDGGTDLNGISGGAGNDTAVGGSAGDTIFGGTGDDSLTGNGGPDTLIGGDGADEIHGNDNSNDVLVGGIGDGVADVGDAFPDAEADEIDENFVFNPLPGWLDTPGP